MFALVIDSKPPPMPTEICPARIELATVATAYRPDEHSLLMPVVQAVSG